MNIYGNLFKDNNFAFKRGVVGCALSHYNVWKQIAESDYEYCAVFEDDCKFDKTL